MTPTVGSPSAFKLLAGSDGPLATFQPIDDWAKHCPSEAYCRIPTGERLLEYFAKSVYAAYREQRVPCQVLKIWNYGLDQGF